MTLDADVTKLEDRLPPPARFSAWLAAELAADESTATRLFEGGGDIDIWRCWKPTAFYRNATKDTLAALHFLTEPLFSRLQLAPLIGCYADWVDRAVAAKGSKLDRGGLPTAEQIADWYDETLAGIARWWHAFHLFAATEGFDAWTALRVLSPILAVGFEQIAGDLHALAPDDAKVARERDFFLKAFNRCLVNATRSPKYPDRQQALSARGTLLLDPLDPDGSEEDAA